MRARTEDLLKIRDGEPIDAATRARLVADPVARAEIERLERVRGGMRALPELDPPAGLWRRVEAEAASSRRAFTRRRAVGAAAAGLLVALALALVLVPSDDDERSGALTPTRTPAVRNLPPDRAPAAEATTEYAALISESMRLERLMAQLPAQRSVMTLGTAGTIAGLEERIAFVDTHLALGAAEEVDREYAETLWAERVDLMRALVQVRYAQAQPIAY